MKKALTRQPSSLHHYKYDQRIEGKNPKMSGDCTGLSGDCTGLSGNLDACEITAEERAAGVKIQDLIQAAHREPGEDGG